MAIPLGAIILFVVILIILILLCILAVYVKKWLRGDFSRNNETTLDDADEPLLEDGFEIVVEEEKDKNLKASQKLTSSETITAEQIKEKYRKDKSETSSIASSYKDSQSTHSEKHGITDTLLQKSIQLDITSSQQSLDSQISSKIVVKDEKLSEFETTEESLPAFAIVEDYTDPTEDVSQQTIPEASEATPEQPSLNDLLIPPPPPYTPPLSTTESFAGDASINLTLKYIESTKCILGNIKRLENVNMEAANCPRDISFHLKLLPKSKYRMKTPWRVCGSDDLSLTLTIGPVKTAELLEGILCVRLYGRVKANRFARAKCHGECTIKLSNLIGHDGALALTKKLSSKNQFKSTEDLRFTTDDESDNKSEEENK